MVLFYQSLVNAVRSMPLLSGLALILFQPSLDYGLEGVHHRMGPVLDQMVLRGGSIPDCFSHRLAGVMQFFGYLPDAAPLNEM